MKTTSVLLAALLSLTALASLAPAAAVQPAQKLVCTDWFDEDACYSTLCVFLTPPTSFCTTRSICVIGEDRCIGYLACVDRVCVPDPCYTTACFSSRGPVDLDGRALPLAP